MNIKLFTVYCFAISFALSGVCEGKIAGDAKLSPAQEEKMQEISKAINAFVTGAVQPELEFFAKMNSDSDEVAMRQVKSHINDAAAMMKLRPLAP